MRHYTAKEAAEYCGIAHSTFRAYVARGQAPRHSTIQHGMKMWNQQSLDDWRNNRSSKRKSINLKQRKLLHTGRYWNRAVFGDLMQLGISPHNAEALIRGRTAERMPLDLWKDAQHIIQVHKRKRERIVQLQDQLQSFVLTEALDEAARSVVEGEQDIFSAKADLALKAIAPGVSEPLSPTAYDREFWSSQHDRIALAQYLAALPVVETA